MCVRELNLHIPFNEDTKIYIEKYKSVAQSLFGITEVNIGRKIKGQT